MSDTSFGPFSVVDTFHLFPCHAFRRKQTYICNKILVSIKKKTKKEFTKQRDQVIQVNECLMSKEESFVAADREGWRALMKKRLGKRRTVDGCAGLGTVFAGQKKRSEDFNRKED